MNVKCDTCGATSTLSDSAADKANWEPLRSRPGGDVVAHRLVWTCAAAGDGPDDAHMNELREEFTDAQAEQA